MKTKAAVMYESGLPRPYASSQPLKIQALELDDPGPGEVVVKVTAAGLCHSDLSAIDGSRPRPTPMVLGHEAAGVVEAVGPEVHELVPGDHVINTAQVKAGTLVAVVGLGPAAGIATRSEA